MTPEQITQFIQGGEWVSITTELRPSTNKSATGDIQPFYCSRIFTYSPGDRFACTVTNCADANGKVPLVKIVIKGHNAWQGGHPIAQGAYNLDYIADEAYEVTTVIMKFDRGTVPFSVPSSPRTGGNEYVWHCHFLEHEEHDMMRMLVVM